MEHKNFLSSLYSRYGSSSSSSSEEDVAVEKKRNKLGFIRQAKQQKSSASSDDYDNFSSLTDIYGICSAKAVNYPKMLNKKSVIIQEDKQLLIAALFYWRKKMFEKYFLFWHSACKKVNKKTKIVSPVYDTYSSSSEDSFYEDFRRNYSSNKNVHIGRGNSYAKVSHSSQPSAATLSEKRKKYIACNLPTDKEQDQNRKSPSRKVLNLKSYQKSEKIKPRRHLRTGSRPEPRTYALRCTRCGRMQLDIAHGERKLIENVCACSLDMDIRKTQKEREFKRLIRVAHRCFESWRVYANKIAPFREKQRSLSTLMQHQCLKRKFFFLLQKFSHTHFVDRVFNQRAVSHFMDGLLYKSFQGWKLYFTHERKTKKRQAIKKWLLVDQSWTNWCEFALIMKRNRLNKLKSQKYFRHKMLRMYFMKILKYYILRGKTEVKFQKASQRYKNRMYRQYFSLWCSQSDWQEILIKSTAFNRIRRLKYGTRAWRHFRFLKLEKQVKLQKALHFNNAYTKKKYWNNLRKYRKRRLVKLQRYEDIISCFNTKMVSICYFKWVDYITKMVKKRKKLLMAENICHYNRKAKMLNSWILFSKEIKLEGCALQLHSFHLQRFFIRKWLNIIQKSVILKSNYHFFRLKMIFSASEKYFRHFSAGIKEIKRIRECRCKLSGFSVQRALKRSIRVWMNFSFTNICLIEKFQIIKKAHSSLLLKFCTQSWVSQIGRLKKNRMSYLLLRKHYLNRWRYNSKLLVIKAELLRKCQFYEQIRRRKSIDSVFLRWIYFAQEKKSKHTLKLRSVYFQHQKCIKQWLKYSEIQKQKVNQKRFLLSYYQNRILKSYFEQFQLFIQFRRKENCNSTIAKTAYKNRLLHSFFNNWASYAAYRVGLNQWEIVTTAVFLKSFIKTVLKNWLQYIYQKSELYQRSSVYIHEREFKTQECLFQKWRSQYKCLLNDRSLDFQADQWHDHYRFHKCIERWMIFNIEKTMLQEKNQLSVNHWNRSLKMNGVRKLRRSILTKKKTREVVEIGKKFYIRAQFKVCIKLWVFYKDQRIDYKTLLEKGIFFHSLRILSKSFHKLRSYSSQSRQVREKYCYLLKYSQEITILNSWRKLHQYARNRIINRNNKLAAEKLRTVYRLKKSVYIWHTCSSLRKKNRLCIKKALSLLTKRCHENCFNSLKSYTKSRQRHRWLIQKVEVSFNSSIQQKSIAKWRTYSSCSSAYRKLNRKATEIFMNKNFHCWVNFIACRKEGNILKHRSIKLWSKTICKKYFLLWQYSLKCFQTHVHGLSSKFQTRYFFVKWKNEINRSQENESKLHYALSILFANLLSTYFLKWTKYYLVKNEGKSMLKRGQNHYLRVNIKKWHFLSRDSKLAGKKEIISKNFREKMIRKRYFRKLRSHKANSLKLKAALIFSTLNSQCYYWKKWSAFVKNEKDAREKMHVVVNVLINNNLLTSVNTWREKTLERKQFKYKLKIADIHYLVRLSQRSFCSWHAIIVQWKKLRKMSLFCNLFFQKNLSENYFFKWTKYICYRNAKYMAIQYCERIKREKVFHHWAVIHQEEKSKLHIMLLEAERYNNHSMTFYYWSQWCCYLKYKSQLHQAISYSFRALSKRCLSTWKIHTKRVILLQAACFNWQKLSIVCGVNTWKEFVKNRKRVAKFYKIALEFSSNDLLRRVLKHWYENASYKKIQSIKLELASSHWLKRQVSASVRKWHRFAKKMHEQFCKVNAFEVKRIHNLFLQIFQKFRDECFRKKHQRLVVQECISFHVEISLKRSILSWRSFYHRRKRIHWNQKKAENYLILNIFSLHWTKWRNIFITYKRNVHNNQIANKHFATHLSFAVLNGLKELMSRRRALKLLQSSIYKTRYIEVLLKQTFQVWYSKHIQLHFLTRIDKLNVNAVLHRIFHRWCEYVSRSRESYVEIAKAISFGTNRTLKNTFSHWESVTTEEWIEKQTERFARLFFKSHLQSFAFRKWKRVVVEDYLRRKQRQQIRLRHRPLLFKIYQIWYSRSKIKRIKKLIEFKVQHKLIEKAFWTWIKILCQD